MTEELKPCAYCGSPHIWFGFGVESDTKECFFEIRCSGEDCGITMRWATRFKSPPKVCELMTQAWNTRT